MTPEQIHKLHNYDRTKFNDVSKYTMQDLKDALASQWTSFEREQELEAELIRRRDQELQDLKCVMVS